MAEDEGLNGEPLGRERSRGRPVAEGFAAGLVVGALLGAGIALLFAPDRGSRTRSHLSRRLHRLREQASDELDRVGSRTRRDLQRRRRELEDRLERAAERVRDRLS
jgi:gas vesicle protein